MQPSLQSLERSLERASLPGKLAFCRSARVLFTSASAMRSHQNAKHARLLGDLGRDRREALLAQKLDHDLGFVVVDRRELQVRFPDSGCAGGRDARGRLRRRGAGAGSGGGAGLVAGPCCGRGLRWVCGAVSSGARRRASRGLARGRSRTTSGSASVQAGATRLPAPPTGEEFRPTM